jgi:hypothetical protein
MLFSLKVTCPILCCIFKVLNYLITRSTGINSV